ncbi:hypothetical protein NA56DRAFT_74224 [Hyaloscypha hepaticicola]|uniref:Carbohydrate-binding module family 1 protein n=1 Tax=Hyaloscypha hepaticicola TaxID=2082293 RepID=A0A2J6Q915_9HELO|nr:hypothetical protein NA56DRAFT_74224 [Hyaloscypha hepaticicola]
MFSPAFDRILIGLFGFVDMAFAASCAAEYAQCGGSGWTGATCCQTPYVCSVQNSYYAQCLTAAPAKTSTSTSHSGSAASSSVTVHTSSSSTSTVSAITSQKYTTSISASTTSHAQSPYPVPTATDSCGSWTLVDNVCCPTYCNDILTSESCSGYTAAECGSCISPPSADCKSGTMYNETLSVSNSEIWHYSRSTHFGLTSGGACGFGLYGLCTTGGKDASWIDPWIQSTCSAFCTAYPLLCQDPTSTSLTMRGNFAAPNGDYYTQFWPSLPGDLDNYLSCGECFELIQTYPNGSDYAVGDAGYTPPIILEVVDSCPCDANSKWCCGPGADHCAEIDFKYGCPLPTGSIHLDLSDIAMGRLQGNGSLAAGVIPTRYKRTPCPVPGNAYIWLRDSGGPYYFALSIVNTYGVGSVVSVEIMASGSTVWTPMEHDPNYTSSRPQERYGAWTIPSGTGPFNIPIAMRITSASGEQIVNMEAITSFTAPATAPSGWNYIDLGVQFTK